MENDFSKNGLYIEFYPNGSVMKKTFYENNLKNGIEEFYFISLKDIEEIKQLKNINLPIKYYKNEKDFLKNNEKIGNLISKTFYKNGKKEGKQEHYNADLSLEGIINYKNDVIIDDFIEMKDEKGKLKQTTFYKNGKKEGKEIHFKNNEIYEINEYKNGFIKNKYVYENSKLFQKIIYSNFINVFENNSKVIEYKNEKIFKEYKMKNLDIEGLYKIFNPEGHFIAKINFKNGKKHGKTFIYYDNNKIWQIANFKNDKKEGESFEYHKNGNIKIKSNFKNDKIEGDVYFYNENNQLNEIKTYKNGEIVENNHNQIEI